MIGRRDFLKAGALTATGLLGRCGHTEAASQSRPNVVVVLTDDQGYGDLGCHGHPYLKTPNMDALRNESVRLTDFHVAPMCAPTRSQFLTGIDALHNGAYDPTGQQVLLHTRYTLVSDVFRAHGYATALYGKWHLGANFPRYRPHERGFDDSVCFCRGGHGSHPNYWNSDSLDDFYYHNGKLRQYKGNATDLWFRLGKDFVSQCRRQGRPFFLYLPLNAPHIPWLSPAKYKMPYLDKGLDRQHITFYAMISHVDEQLGRFVRFLKREGLWDNTLFIFFTDNGTALHHQKFNAGLRGKKGSVYEGGHRVPCFLSYPKGNLGRPRDIDTLTQCQDLMPTLMEMCQLTSDTVEGMAGTSLAALLRRDAAGDLDDRILVCQASASVPKKWQGAVMWKKWRLINGTELYDLQTDRAQQHNVAARHPEIVAKLRVHYEGWWQKNRVSNDPPYYYVGDEDLMLTAYDWLEEEKGQVYNWPHLRKGQMKNGRYLLFFERAGRYRIALRRWPREADAAIRSGVPQFETFDPYGTPEDDRMAPYIQGKALDIRIARIKLGDRVMEQAVQEDDKEIVFELPVPKGQAYFQTWFVDAAGNEFGAYYIYLTRL